MKNARAFGIPAWIGYIWLPLILTTCSRSNSAVPPTVEISATPGSTVVDQSSTLTWSSTGATSCTASGGWAGSQSLSGTVAVSPTTVGTQAYTLTCTGAGGGVSATASITTLAIPLSIKIPAGFSADLNLLSINGPTNLNNFQSAYLEGGVIPTGGAEIDITSITSPPPPLNNFIDVELSAEGGTISSRSTITVSEIPCIQVEFSSLTLGNTSNMAVYCVSSNVLYKFYLTYYSNDTNSATYISDFQGVLASVVFP